MESKFKVIILKRDGKSITHNCEWIGTNLGEGEIVAAYLFAKELIKHECLANGELDTWCKKINFEYTDKVKDIRIVLVRNFSFDYEAGKTTLPTLKSYGDETINYGSTIRFG